jgi:hypothetical protein
MSESSDKSGSWAKTENEAKRKMDNSKIFITLALCQADLPESLRKSKEFVKNVKSEKSPLCKEFG